MRTVVMLALLAGLAGAVRAEVEEPPSRDHPARAARWTSEPEDEPEERESATAEGPTWTEDDEPPLPEPVDANGDGISDLGNILAAIDRLKAVGVIFDDTDPQGHIPVKRKDGRYHMACVDLLLVSYRAAGYRFGERAVRAKSADKGAAKPQAHGSGRFRQVTTLIREIKRDRRFRYYPGPGINPRTEKWVPETPFRVGDMVFVHYDDNEDRHSGIVTGVDPSTGLPSYITQVSIYSENEGMHRSTFNEFFSLKCRQLTGWARPAAWDAAEPPPEEIPLTATPAPPARPVAVAAPVHPAQAGEATPPTHR